MGKTPDDERRPPPWAARLKRFGQGAQNALELMRGGRFSAPYRAQYEVAYEDATSRLRHYAPEGDEPGETPPVLLVPPLMVTSEIYDISPELSAVTWLRTHGVDVWVIDFGAPESESGGMSRTLDDHVLAVNRAVDHVFAATGLEVNLAGYSQGGMFVYQCAAYRVGRGLASLITFGSPVDIHRNLPSVRDDVAGRLLRGAREAIARPLEQLQGLPGKLTSTGFRLLSVRKEFQQVLELVQLLPDREALGQREKRRRFIAGEGFVAWPGPALRTFIDEFIVNNRMADGGFVIDGRTVTLSDIELPILCFIGTRDEIARPAAVRAIRTAAPNAQVHELEVAAGHFGIVVGSRSLAETWPAVRDWARWTAGFDELPSQLRPQQTTSSAALEPDEVPFEDVELGVEFLYDMATDLVEEAWARIGDASSQVGNAIDVLRWQLPRIAKVKRLDDSTEISISRALAEQAAAIPDATFFLWHGRAFTYRQANERVSSVSRGLWLCGVRPEARVAVLMGNRPTYLSAVAALSRVGAVAVLLHPDADEARLTAQLEAADVTALLCDPDHVESASRVWKGQTLVLGGGTERAVAAGVVDMEAIDVASFEFPDGFVPDSGRGGDLALLLYSAASEGAPHAVHVTNRRWALTGLATAAACRLTSNDTVYCCLPLATPNAMLVAIGGALLGGARLGLARGFEVDAFWGDVRRYGATIAFYSEEICRRLLEAEPSRGESENPIRVLAGSGMTAATWARIMERLRPDRIVEMYSSTASNAMLVNLSGAKVGSVGRPFPGSPEVKLLRADERGRPLYGFEVDNSPAVDEPGLLAVRLSAETARSFAPDDPRVLRGVVGEGDAWLDTRDVLTRDADGDYFFVRRLVDGP